MWEYNTLENRWSSKKDTLDIDNYNFIKEEKSRNNPFFLYLSMPENHVPRIPNSKFEGQSESGLRGDAVQELDWVVGQVVDFLEVQNIREETMIIFSSLLILLLIGCFKFITSQLFWLEKLI